MLGSSAGIRVLVVDDVEDLRILIRRALTARGYEVDVAATLAEARGMDPGGYDAVLVDAHLGHERGSDLVEALRAEDPAALRRCLIMTGGAPEALPDGVACLSKPFQIGELLDAVRGLHERETGDPTASQAPGRHVANTRDASPPAAGPPAAAPPAGAPPAGAPPGAAPPAGAQPLAWQLLRLTRRLRARERHELIDFLHDGPIQEITAVTLELQMISRSTPDAPRLDAAIKQLHAAAGSLRWLVDGPWQSVQPETQLAPALHERSAWLLAAPLTVHGDQAADLAAAEIPVIADVVELMLLGIVTASPPAEADVAVRAGQQHIEIELTLTSAGDDQAIGDPASARAALDGLASALGARADVRLCGPSWQARMVLNRQPAAPPGQSRPPGE